MVCDVRRLKVKSLNFESMGAILVLILWGLGVYTLTFTIKLAKKLLSCKYHELLRVTWCR